VGAEELLQALSTLQDLVPVGRAELSVPSFPAPDGGSVVADVAGVPRPLTASVLKGLVLRRIEETTGGAGRLPRLEEDTIDFLGMLFDYILEDPTLPALIRAALGRLQIPLLKLAVMDKTFFSHKAHPARRLLNDLARAGVGLDSGERRDAVCAKVEAVVERVVTSFTGATTLFEELLSEFQAFLATDQARARVVEEREVAALEGRERLELARARVDHDLDLRLARRILPVGLRRFVEEVWRHYLVLTCLENGSEGEKYTAGLALLDGLLWSVEPKLLRRERDEMLGRVRPLLEDLRHALDNTFLVSDTQRASFLREIQTCQLAALRGQDPAAPERARLAEIPFPAAPPPESPPAAARPPSSPSPTKGKAEVEAATGDEHDRQVQELPLGTWVELERDGERSRVKLSWRSTVTSRCLLVNRQGMKAIELSLEDLASCLRRGAAKVIEGAPLMDRAMEAVLQGLKTAPVIDFDIKEK
jgi:hypothetical protein